MTFCTQESEVSWNQMFANASKCPTWYQWRHPFIVKGTWDPIWQVWIDKFYVKRNCLPSPGKPGAGN